MELRCFLSIIRAKNRDGFLLLDVLVGVAVFAVFAGIIGVTMLASQESTLGSGDRMRGVYLADEALETVRSVRDQDFDSLTNGTYGFELSGGRMGLTETPTETSDGYQVAITLTEQSENQFEAVARASWNFGQTRSGSVVIRTELTNWRRVNEIGNWASVSLQGSYIDAGTPLFNKVVTRGDYAFVTSEISDGGAGLYVFDISNLALPQRVAIGFDLGSAGYGLAVSSGSLFIATSDESSEVQVYDISSPSSLSADDLVTSINLPGSGLARDLTVFNDTLYIAAAESASEDELYTYDVSDLGAVTFQDSFNEDMSGGYLSISLHNGYAYLGTTSDTLELRVVDVFDPADLQAAPGNGYNLTDVQDTQAIAAFGTSAILGRSNGAVIEELVLFDIADSAVPSPPPGPWYYEMGDSARDIDADPSGMYAFIASDFDNAELLVVSLSLFVGGQPPNVGFYNTETGDGRGLNYDIQRDRIFFVTNTAFLILSPG